MSNSQFIARICAIVLATGVTSCGEAEQKFRVRVMDDAGTVLPGVECKAWFHRRGETSPLASYSVTGKTDGKGIVELQGETISYQTSVQAQPEGYYLSNIAGHWISGKKGGRWEPWPVDVVLVLKEIRQPHPMYAIKGAGLEGTKFPAKNLESCGFDLLARDWVAPHGKGRFADILVSGKVTDPDKQETDPVGMIDIAFSNDADGIQRLADHTGGSALLGPYEAPLADYVGEWSFPNRSANGKGWDFTREVYAFRIRSKLDREGNVISAIYGKLHGRIRGLLSPLNPRIEMTYYLNGDANDRNLEWNRTKNLFADLPKEHWPMLH